MSDIERASAHYSDQLKAALFAEVVSGLRELLDDIYRDPDCTCPTEAAAAILAKIDQNELLRS